MDELEKLDDVKKESARDCLIALECVVVKWPESDQNTLSDVTFNAGPGQLLAVIGQVGSGKVNYFLLF